MKRMLDTCILFIASSFILGNLSGFTETVVMVLVAFILTMLLFCIDGDDIGKMPKKDKYILIVYLGCNIAGWCVQPLLMIYMPVLVYSFIFFNAPIYCTLSLALLININFHNVVYISAIFILCLIAWAMAFSTRKMEKLEVDIKKIRDSGRESDIKLKEKNRQILINQDNEIYMATLKERNRIAREIHDNVGHMLTRSILQVGALATIYKEEPFHTQIEGIQQTLNVAMNNIRESVHDIHDDAIDLKQALLDCTKDVKDKFNFKFDYDMSRNIPRDIKYSFIAIAKEAMANIIKHSNGTEVFLVVREHPGFYQIVIEDNGTKDESSAKNTKDVNRSQGIGLINMQERVVNLKGRMHINREDGFKIFISIPKAE